MQLNCTSLSTPFSDKLRKTLLSVYICVKRDRVKRTNYEKKKQKKNKKKRKKKPKKTSYVLLLHAHTKYRYPTPYSPPPSTRPTRSLSLSLSLSLSHSHSLSSPKLSPRSTDNLPIFPLFLLCLLPSLSSYLSIYLSVCPSLAT